MCLACMHTCERKVGEMGGLADRVYQLQLLKASELHDLLQATVGDWAAHKSQTPQCAQMSEVTTENACNVTITLSTGYAQEAAGLWPKETKCETPLYFLLVTASAWEHHQLWSCTQSAR